MIRFATELRQLVLENGEPVRVEKSELLCKQGDPAEFLYYSPETSLEIKLYTGRLDEEIFIDYVRPGDCFYLMDSLYSTTYPANLYATQSSRIMRVPGDLVKQFLIDNPEITKRLNKYFNYAGMQKALKRFDFNFSEMDELEIEQKDVTPNEIPNWKQGIYVLNSGRAIVTTRSGKGLKEKYLASGDIIQIGTQLAASAIQILEASTFLHLTFKSENNIYKHLNEKVIKDTDETVITQLNERKTAPLSRGQIEQIRSLIKKKDVSSVFTTQDAEIGFGVTLFNLCSILDQKISWEDAFHFADFIAKGNHDLTAVSEVLEANGLAVQFVHLHSTSKLDGGLRLLVAIVNRQLVIGLHIYEGRIFCFDPIKGIKKVRLDTFLKDTDARALLVEGTPGIQDLLQVHQDPKFNTQTLKKFIFQNLKIQSPLFINLLGIAVLMGILLSSKGIIFQKIIAQISSIQDKSVLWGYGSLLLGIAVFYLVLNTLFTLLSEYLRISITSKLKTLMLKVQFFSYSLSRSSSSQAQFVGRVDSMDGFTSQLISNPLQLIKSGVSLFIMVVFLATISMKYFLIYSAFIIVAVLILLRFIRQATDTWLRLQSTPQAKQRVVFSDFSRILFSFASDLQKKYFMERSEESLIEQDQLSQALPKRQKNILFYLKMAGLFFYSFVYYNGITDSFTQPEAAASISGFLIYLGFVYAECNHFFILFANFSQWTESFSQLQPFFTPNEVYNMLKHKLRFKRLTGKLRFDGVSFKYPEITTPSLSQVSAVIYQGEILAVVGKSGSGKSTFSKLIAQELVPVAGKILFDDQENKNLFPSVLRSQVILVPRRPQFFPGTVTDNILVNKAMDKEFFTHVLDYAGIPSNPAARVRLLRQEISGQQSGLSAGELQMVGIARALYQRPKILILDEATSFLDSRTETEIIDNLYKEKQERTVILVTHQLSLTKYADRIFVFKDGMLVEVGNHDQLLRSGREYTELYRTKGGLD